MNVLKRVLQLLNNRVSKLKKHNSIENFSEFENSYLEHATFYIIENHILSSIILLFTEDVDNNAKAGIMCFLKYGFENNIDISILLSDIKSKFELSVTKRKCSDPNELKLYISKINL